MNEDLTKEMPEHPTQLAQILALVQDVSADVKDLKQRVTVLEDKVELRAYDTRPLWDRVIGELDRLSQGQEELRTEMRRGQEELRTEMRRGQEELRTELRTELVAIRVEFTRELKKMDRKFDQIFGNQGELRAQVTILEDRMDKIAPEA